MIRIDEIYDNVFLPKALQYANPGNEYNSNYSIGLHWFEPFGTTEFKNLANKPPVAWWKSKPGYPTDNTRIIFWDQEPLHQYRFKPFIESFLAWPYEAVHYKLVTSEYQSQDVRWACDTYGLESLYYFFHGWAALDWYRGYNRTSLAQPFQDRKPYNTFLCPNNIVGGDRKHRIMMLNEFVNRNLLQKNLISFPDVCPYEGLSVKRLCEKYSILEPDVELPLMIDNGSGYAAQSHRIDLWEQANNSLIHVVTETAYWGDKQHLTEKTFKPIVLQQPFILQSCRGSLEYLRRYGFRTFGDFWDESYDDCDDQTRTSKIGQLLEDLNGLSQKEKASLQKALSNTVWWNHQWFYGEMFERLLWDELQAMMKQWK